ncbi:MAG: HD domain-containing protein [Clostridia bacterium]
MGRMKLLNKFSSGNTQVEGYCIIKSVTLKSNVKGSDYLDLVLCDAGGEVDAKLWDYSVEQHGQYYPDTVIKIRATINLWKDAEQLKIDRIRNLAADDNVDMAELVPCAPRPGQEMYDELFATAENFTNADLRMLTQYILRENHEKLIKWPAALKLHHAVRAGLLYHTCTMLEGAKALCDVYGKLYPIDRELVYAGIILHDISKVDELVVGELGLAGSYSKCGQLLGHISMGVANIERAAAELMIDDETKLQVQHILLSHHNQPEFGSPRYPMFPEAQIVSELDLIDSKLFEMYDALSAAKGGEFTERQWALDNRQLYKKP